MATIQIRDIPDEAYEAVRSQASAEGKSLQAYMRDEVEKLADRTRKLRALDAVHQAWQGSSSPGITAAEAAAAVRELRGD